LICVEKSDEQKPKTGKAIGIDVGIRFFLADSERRLIKIQNFMRKL